MSVRHRNYCFTLKNFTNDHLVLLPTLVEQTCCTFICYSKQIDSTTGISHLQGYLELKQPMSLFNIQNKIGINEIVLFVKESTKSQAINYCKYEDYPECNIYNKTFQSFGKERIQGGTGNLCELAENLKKGKTNVETIAREYPKAYQKYKRTLHKTEDILLRKKFRTWMTTCDWYIEPNNNTKFLEVVSTLNPETDYLWNNNGWQNKYTGQKHVIVNNFTGQIAYSDLLHMIDKWPYEVRRRNRSHFPFLAEHITITSSYKPEDIYFNIAEEESLDQLYRRVNCFTRNHKNEPWTEYIPNKKRKI